MPQVWLLFARGRSPSAYTWAGQLCVWISLCVSASPTSLNATYAHQADIVNQDLINTHCLHHQSRSLYFATAPMETSSKPKTRRSKKGCRTYRIRRMKCDETSPSCTRCASTGRTCEWFGVFRDRLGTVKPRLRPQQVLAKFPDAKAQELRGFKFFQHRTAREMCPWFDFGFWTSLVLQLSQSEPAVLHAFGVIHETEESLGMPISKDRLTHNEKHKFAVGQYNAAIRLLLGPDGNFRVLATCLIFIHIDLMRGLYEAARGHIRSGPKILEESGNVLSHDVSRMMRTGFCRLDLQAADFDAEAPYYKLLVDELAVLDDALSQPFMTLEDAKEQYDTLL
ncbi:unnamed protein product [Clonostachys rhizophaga]|uniref:Zn(2)-C6 fungal-type domain-containing protein n=1 Tax=Clonostachys rhizophaga TaxID=160324 RepID=A0A9N9YRN0_9HYPO|nr:unnamed protein product [Clonostachys rhizophaga]